LELLDEVEEEEIDLFLGNLGLASEESWRLVSLLRARFKHWSAIIPFAASPASTQVALGADEIIMGDGSSLSTMEDSIQREKGSPSPSELEALLTLLKDNNLSPESLVPLWSKIDFRVLGALERARLINREIIKRCLNGRQEEQLEEILSLFCNGGLGPGFPLTAKDCRDLNLPVKTPDADTCKAIRGLHRYYSEMLSLEGDLNLKEKHYSVSYEAFIDTLQARRLLLKITRVDDRGHALAEILYRWVQPAGRDVEVDKELDLE